MQKLHRLAVGALVIYVAICVVNPLWAWPTAIWASNERLAASLEDPQSDKYVLAGHELERRGPRAAAAARVGHKVQQLG